MKSNYLLNICLAACALALAAPAFAHEGEGSCPVPAKTAKKATAPVKGGKTLALKLSGLHCEGCAMSVQSHLLKVPGVAAVKVNPKTQSAAVTLKKGAKRPADATVKAAVKSAGYQCLAVR